MIYGSSTGFFLPHFGDSLNIWEMSKLGSSSPQKQPMFQTTTEKLFESKVQGAQFPARNFRAFFEGIPSRELT